MKKGTDDAWEDPDSKAHDQSDQSDDESDSSLSSSSEKFEDTGGVEMTQVTIDTLTHPKEIPPQDAQLAVRNTSFKTLDTAPRIETKFGRKKSTRYHTVNEAGLLEMRENRSLKSVEEMTKHMEDFGNISGENSVNLVDCWSATKEFVRSLDRENQRNVDKLTKDLHNGERKTDDLRNFLNERDKYYEKYYKFEKSRNFLNAHFDIFDEREACSREIKELLADTQTNIDSMLRIDRAKRRIHVSAKHRTGFNSLYSELREKTLKLAQLDFQYSMETDSQKILQRRIMEDSLTGVLRDDMSLTDLTERWIKLFNVPFRAGEFKEYLQKFFPEAFDPDVGNRSSQLDIGETSNDNIIVNYEMIKKYILFEHHLNASKVLGLLYDRQRTDNFFLVETFWGCSRFACFIFLWVLLIVYLFTNEGYLSGKVLQTMGARDQLLFTDFYEGKEFMDITNSKEMFFFLEAVAFPILYGLEEVNRPSNWSARGYSSDPFDTGLAMNPYLMGGVRMRVVRFQRRDCESVPPSGITNPFDRCVSSLEKNIEKTDWTNFVNAPYIEQTLHHNSQSDLDEQDVIRGLTKYGYDPGGYVWDFPSLFSPQYYNATTKMPLFPSTSEEIEHCSCVPSLNFDPVGDPYDTDCFVSIDQPLALCDALLQLESFRKYGVVDEQTRGVFFDFNLYGPSSQLHTLGRIFFEFKYGLIYPNHQFDSYQLLISDRQRLIYYCFSLVLILFILVHVYELNLYCHILGCPGCANDIIESINLMCNKTCCRPCPNCSNRPPCCDPEPQYCCRMRCGRHCCRIAWANLYRDLGKVPKALAEYEVKIGLQRVVGRILRCRCVCCRICCGNFDSESHLESVRFMRIKMEKDPENAVEEMDRPAIELTTRIREDEGKAAFDLAKDIMERARTRKENDPKLFLPTKADENEQVRKDAKKLDEWRNDSDFLKKNRRVKELLDRRMPGWRGEKRLYLRIPFTNTTGNRVYLRLGQIQRVIERACHQFFEREFNLSKGERFVRPDRIKKNAYGGVDSFWIINVPKDQSHMIINFDSFENQVDNDSGLCHGIFKSAPKFCRTCVGMDKQRAQKTKQTKFDESTTRGVGNGLALPQQASDAEIRFCKLIYRELVQSLDTDEYLSEAKITLYRRVSIKDIGQSFMRYFFGMGVKIMYRQAIYVIDAILIFLFSFYLYLFYDANSNYDEHKLLDTETFNSLRYIKEREDYSRFLLFCLFLFSCLRLTYAIVRLNKQAEVYWQVLCHSLTQLIGFGLLLGFIMVTFAFGGWALFGGQMIEFGDPFQSVQTMIRSLVNDLPISEMQDASMWGSLYYILWFFFIPFMFLNIIVAILLTAWDKIKKEQETSQNTHQNWQEFQNHWRACTKIVVCCNCCSKKISESSETRIQGGQFTGNPKEWQAVYPAGCPPEKLTTYLRKYWGVNRSVDNIIDIIDSDGGGTISWEEIRDKLINVHPNLASGIFNLHDQTHRRMNRIDLKLEAVRNKVVNEDSWESEMINTFGLKKKHTEEFRKVGYDDQSIWDQITRDDLVKLGFLDRDISKWQKGMCKKMLKDIGLGTKFYAKFKDSGNRDVTRWKLISDDNLRKLNLEDGHIKKWRMRFPYLNPNKAVDIFQGRVGFL